MPRYIPRYTPHALRLPAPAAAARPLYCFFCILVTLHIRYIAQKRLKQYKNCSFVSVVKKLFLLLLPKMKMALLPPPKRKMAQLLLPKMKMALLLLPKLKMAFLLLPKMKPVLLLLPKRKI